MRINNYSQREKYRKIFVSFTFFNFYFRIFVGTNANKNFLQYIKNDKRAF